MKNERNRSGTTRKLTRIYARNTQGVNPRLIPRISASINKVLLVGNEAMAEAAIKAGCHFYAGYPITPQNELTAYLAREMPANARVFLQAESELAAINMVFGASAAGFRAMTSSSSPGISLKQEGISYLAGCELPAVIINVMRGGPGLGNIASSQADYFQATRGGGHGDYFTLTLAPASVEEAAQLVGYAFDLADYYRNPVLVLADAIIGQMMEPVIMQRAKSKEQRVRKPWALSGCKGRTPNIIKSFFLREGELEKHNEKLRKKWELIKEKEQKFEVQYLKDAEYLIVAYGSQARITQEAVNILRKKNIKIGLFRPITLWPYPQKGLRAYARRTKRVYVVEQSLGQMVEDVRLASPSKEVLFLGRTGGGIPSVLEIVKFVEKNL